uniref:Uncharacterized protein n=1 Tax=viral metagenome TaxID=1070528 RepID=A0A2V0RAF6_9ZZZZ
MAVMAEELGVFAQPCTFIVKILDQPQPGSFTFKVASKPSAKAPFYRRNCVVEEPVNVELCIGFVPKPIQEKATKITNAQATDANSIFVLAGLYLITDGELEDTFMTGAELEELRDSAAPILMADMPEAESASAGGSDPVEASKLAKQCPPSRVGTVHPSANVQCDDGSRQCVCGSVFGTQEAYARHMADVGHFTATDYIVFVTDNPGLNCVPWPPTASPADGYACVVKLQSHRRLADYIVCEGAVLDEIRRATAGFESKPFVCQSDSISSAVAAYTKVCAEAHIDGIRERKKG